MGKAERRYCYLLLAHKLWKKSRIHLVVGLHAADYALHESEQTERCKRR